MHPDPLIESIAARLLAVRSGGSPIATADLDPALQSTAQALAIQARVIDHLGPVGGWKCGGPSPDAEHILAPVPACRLHTSPSRQDAGHYRFIGIELEIGYVLDRIPTGPDLESELFECARPFAAIEIVDSRLAEPLTAPAAWKLADMQLNGALVFAAPVETSDFDPAAPIVDLRFDDRPMVTGLVACPGGHPLQVLARFLRACGSHCGGVRRGQPIITGSLTGLRFIEPGTRVRGNIEGLGEVHIDFSGADLGESTNG